MLPDSAQHVGPYRLLEELGRGGMGVVYRARHADLERDVALKLLLGGRDSDPVQRRRFEREGEALAKLRHPGIVSVHSAGQHEGVPYLVMDFVEGKSLQEWIDRSGPLPVAEAVKLARALCAALAHVHAEGLLHRDIKPLNVLLGPDGAPRLTDFGLTRDLDPAQDERLSQTGQFLGSPGYCSPEQVRGERDRLGPTCDVYGLGATLYAMLTARAPIEAECLFEFIDKVTHHEPDPPSLHREGVPPLLDAVCLRCLEREPAARFQGAEELDAALEEALRPAAVPTRAPLALTALLLGAGVIGAVWILSSRTRSQTPPSAAPASSPTASTSASPPETASPSPVDPRAKAQYDRGNRLLGEGDPQQAHEAYDEAIRLDPRYGRAYNNRAVAKERLGDLEGALADYDLAVAAELTPPEARFNRALARLDRDDPAGALADAQALLAVDPTDPDAYVIRARVALVRGDRAGAHRELERSLDQRPTPEAYVERSQLRIQERDFHGAVRDVELALIVTPPGDPRRPQLEQQVTALRPLLVAAAQGTPELNPAEKEALQSLLREAGAHEARSEWTETLELYQRALSALPPVSESARALRSVVARTHARRAEARLKAGAIRGAIPDLEQALTLLAPEHPKVRWLKEALAQARNELGER